MFLLAQTYVVSTFIKSFCAPISKKSMESSSKMKNLIYFAKPIYFISFKILPIRYNFFPVLEAL